MDIIKSKSNETIKLASKLVSDKKERQKQGLFVIEGLRLCLDAFYSNIAIDTLLVTEECYKKYEEKIEEIKKSAKNFYLIDNSLCAKISDTTTPQGVFCVCKALDKLFTIDKIINDGYYLALENISDPGNMGTIIRTADAFGISALFLSDDCVDIYSPKVIRSTMGAIFRLPIIIVSNMPKLIDILNSKNITSYAAVLDENSKRLSQTTFPSSAVVVIGNEGSGITQNTIESCNHKLFINMKGKSESLNAGVAASVIMWEMSKNI